MMKLFTRLMIVLVILSLASCQSRRQPEILSLEPTEAEYKVDEISSMSASTFFDIAWDDRLPFYGGLVASERPILNQLEGATVYHMDLFIADDLISLTGHQEVRYTNQEDEPLNKVCFRLYPNLFAGEITISALKIDDQEMESTFEAYQSAMWVKLSTALEPGAQITIEMDFTVEVPVQMSGNYGLFGYFNGKLMLHEFYPVIPVYDDEGWNAELPPRQGDVTYLDASFYLVRVTAPATLTVVTSGIEVSRIFDDDIQVLTFAAGPARDFYLTASDQYTAITETVGETTVRSYSFTELKEGSELALRYATDALESYNARFGVYPYTEFDIVSTPMQALGMEYPGIVVIAQNLYDPDEKIAGLPSSVYLESTVAHEVAHQWFFNAVGNDQVDEPWLDEAIVQYSTGLYHLDVHGERGAQDYRNSWSNRWGLVDYAEIPIGMPTGSYSDSEYGAIVYGRGPLFIEALAEELGQDIFDSFLRDYYETYKWGIGTGSVFKQLAEHHCQCDLTNLFETWVYEKE